MRSTLGDLVLWLRQEAERNGRAQIQDPKAAAIIAALQTGQGDPDGVELYLGKPKSNIARQIMRAATNRLRDLSFTLFYIDEFGYTTISLRALLANHYARLRSAPLDSDENDAYIDLQTALGKVSPQTRLICSMLVEGASPKEVGEKFATNGSRRISRACLDLVRVLEGPRKREDDL